MTNRPAIELPESTWNVSAASTSLERWQALCDREQWQPDSNTSELIARIFGASWYFTRFIFYRGQEIFSCLQTSDSALDDQAMYDRLCQAAANDDTESALDQLRVFKNEIMLQVFVDYLTDRANQRETEDALTRLAGHALGVAIDIAFSDNEDKKHFAVLGMGRMAGGEMTFGSDLDLVFLYTGDDQELFARLGRQVRIFLREIAAMSPTGILYEVDTRLRPHGSSGVLITSADAFARYHASDIREIWERQMMTRCRPVYDRIALAESAYQGILPNIYRHYDRKQLREAITSMRHRVERELGSPREKFDIKRGCGGIMDIDFITHYYQLALGAEYPALQTPSTRKVLSNLQSEGLLDESSVSELLSAYDYLKRVETCMRVYDMKSIDTISRQHEANVVIARAMGYQDGIEGADTESFLRDYQQCTEGTRGMFQHLLEAT